MNIKERIEAGHYQTDHKGRALVPIKDGRVATIYATDGPSNFGKPEYPIVGVIEAWGGIIRWDSLGRDEVPPGSNCTDLLPPPPRKVKVTRWLVISKNNEMGPFADKEDAEHCAKCWRAPLVELTGEYEEAWDRKSPQA